MRLAFLPVFCLTAFPASCESHTEALGPMSKNRMPLKSAKEHCKSESKRLAKGTFEAIKYLQQHTKTAWVRKLKVDLEDIPEGLTLYYPNRKKCCKARQGKEKCHVNYCSKCAAVLCTSK